MGDRDLRPRLAIQLEGRLWLCSIWSMHLQRPILYGFFSFKVDFNRGSRISLNDYYTHDTKQPQHRTTRLRTIFTILTAYIAGQSP